MLSRTTLLYIIAGLILCIAALHAAAFSFYLYWSLWWYDLLLHYLGGAFAALIFVWVRYYSGYFRLEKPTMLRLCVMAIAGALLVGAGWELFERLLNVHIWWSGPEGYVLDTMMDIVMDTLGGITAAFVLMRLSRASTIHGLASPEVSIVES